MASQKINGVTMVPKAMANDSGKFQAQIQFFYEGVKTPHHVMNHPKEYSTELEAIREANKALKEIVQYAKALEDIRTNGF